MDNSEFKAKEEKLERLKIDNEVAQEEVALSQRKAAIADAKKRYGRDWKKVLGLIGSVKINSESLHNLHSMGGSDNELRDMSNPFKFSHKR